MEIQFYVVDGKKYIGPVAQQEGTLVGLVAVPTGDFERQVAEYLCLTNVNKATSFFQLANVCLIAIPFDHQETAQAAYLEQCFALSKETALRYVENEQFIRTLGK